MANYIDYLKWRGDLTFDACPLNEIDVTLFGMCALVDFSSCLGEREEKTITQAYEEYEKAGNKIKPLGYVIPAEVVKLFKEVARSERFAKTKLKNFRRKIDSHKVSQFSAITAEDENFRIISFSGTDDTVIGWEENITMLTRKKIPAQELAVKYLKEFVKDDKKNYIVGHSKGGNLAMYGYVHAPQHIRKSIEIVYSLDGPGILYEEWNEELCDKIVEIMPQDATIGRLFNHYGKVRFVESTHVGINQHDSFSWRIHQTHYIESKQTKESVVVEKVINEIVQSLTLEEREKFATIFSAILKVASSNTLTELNKNKMGLVKGYLSQQGEDRKFFTKTILKLFSVKEVRSSFWKGIKENRKGITTAHKANIKAEKKITKQNQKLQNEDSVEHILDTIVEELKETDKEN